MSQDAAQSKAQSQQSQQKSNQDAASAAGNNAAHSAHSAPGDGSVSGGPVPPFTFHPSSGPKDAIQLPAHIPQCGIDRARALRKAWLIQTRELPPPREEPDFDTMEEEFDDEIPFSEPVHLPNLLLLLIDLFEEENY